MRGSRPGNQTQTWWGCILERIHQRLCRGTPSLCCRRKSLRGSEQGPPSHGHKLYHLNWGENQVSPVCTTPATEPLIRLLKAWQTLRKGHVTLLTEPYWPVREPQRSLGQQEHLSVQTELNSNRVAHLQVNSSWKIKRKGLKPQTITLNLCSLTCWNLISRSNVIGSLGLQIGGTVYSIFWAVVQGISFTVYVPE